MNAYDADVSEEDIEEALLFLSKINAIKLEGGFLVLYSGMRIKGLFSIIRSGTSLRTTNS